MLGGHDHEYLVRNISDTLVIKSGTDFEDLSEITVQVRGAARGRAQRAAPGLLNVRVKRYGLSRHTRWIAVASEPSAYLTRSKRGRHRHRVNATVQRHPHITSALEPYTGILRRTAMAEPLTLLSGCCMCQAYTRACTALTIHGTNRALGCH